MLLFGLLVVPKLVPESPRWMLVQGGEKANEVVMMRVIIMMMLMMMVMRITRKPQTQ